jgi:hypothetical protein
MKTELFERDRVCVGDPAATGISNPGLDRWADRINAEHRAVAENLGNAVQHAISAGEFLAFTKKQLAHGQWLPWLAANCPEIGARTAQRYLRLFEHRDQFSKCDTSDAFATLGARLEFLSTPKPKSEPVEVCAAPLEETAPTLPPVCAVQATATHCSEPQHGNPAGNAAAPKAENEAGQRACLANPATLTEFEYAEATNKLGRALRRFLQTFEREFDTWLEASSPEDARISLTQFLRDGADELLRLSSKIGSVEADAQMGGETEPEILAPLGPMAWHVGELGETANGRNGSRYCIRFSEGAFDLLHNGVLVSSCKTRAGAKDLAENCEWPLD